MQGFGEVLKIELTIEQMLMNQKETGAHFTPTDLADVIANRLIKELKKDNVNKNEKLRILDPSCGDGELLLSINRIGRLNKYENVELIGVDEDRDSIQSAHHRLKNIGITETKLIHTDFLELVDLEENLSLFEEEKLRLDPVDLIIANPPYVRTQILGSDRAQKLGDMFHLKGRVDLYHVFLVAMTLQLKPGGLIGVITSNRYLSTSGGESVRQFLAENYDIIEIIDLGDTKLFSAAVLPAIFIGRKKENKEIHQSVPANFYKIYEETNLEKTDTAIEYDSIYEILESYISGSCKVDQKFYTASLGKLIIPESYKEPWVMATDEEYAWITKINEKSYCTIKDVCDVRVGIKTTADKVFIKTKWEDLKVEIQPEAEVLIPLLSTDHAAKWRSLERIPAQRILYTHEIIDGKRKAIDFTKFPHALAYLTTHRETLESRKYVIKAKRKWYEIWVPQNPDSFQLEKLVFPDISPEPKFFYEDAGCFVDGNCYWMVPKEENNKDILFLILGISNTQFMTNYHDIAFNNKLYSGRRRYLTQYVSKYPVPNPNSTYAKQIIDLVKELVFQSPDKEEVVEIEARIEDLTAKAFGVDPL
jgi:adenine-specific DNA-methyltransferase